MNGQATEIEKKDFYGVNDGFWCDSRENCFLWRDSGGIFLCDEKNMDIFQNYEIILDGLIVKQNGVNKLAGCYAFRFRENRSKIFLEPAHIKAHANEKDGRYPSHDVIHHTCWQLTHPICIKGNEYIRVAGQRNAIFWGEKIRKIQTEIKKFSFIKKIELTILEEY